MPKFKIHPHPNTEHTYWALETYDFGTVVEATEHFDDKTKKEFIKVAGSELIKGGCRPDGVKPNLLYTFLFFERM